MVNVPTRMPVDRGDVEPADSQASIASRAVDDEVRPQEHRAGVLDMLAQVKAGILAGEVREEWLPALEDPLRDIAAPLRRRRAEPDQIDALDAGLP